MKNFLYSLGSIAFLFSCKKEPKKIYHDTLAVTQSEYANELLRRYARYEKNYTKAIKKGDIYEIKKYADSANFYDNELFSKEATKKLTDLEENQYHISINNIRIEKMKALQTLKSRESFS